MSQTMETSGGLGERNHARGSQTAALKHIVRAAFQIYGYRDLERNLKTFGWRKARRRVLGSGALSGEWVRRGGSEVRLMRQGLEVQAPGEDIRLLSWQELWEFAQR